MPIEWAATMGNLGFAWSNRIEGDKKDNLEKAIGYYQEALTVRTQDAMPIKWAATTNSLGDAWGNRIEGDKKVNLEKAIGLYRRALTILSRETDPLGKIRVLEHLSGSLISLGKIEGAKRALLEAIDDVEFARALSRIGLIHSRHILEINAGIFEYLVLCHAHEGEDIAAFEFCEKGKGQVLLDMFAMNTDLRIWLNDEERKEHAKLMSYLRGLMHDVEVDSHKIQAGEIRLSIRDSQNKLKEYSDMAKARAGSSNSLIMQTKIVDLDDTWKRFDENTVVIEWFFCEKCPNADMKHKGLIAFLLWNGKIKVLSTEKLGYAQSLRPSLLFQRLRFTDETEREYNGRRRDEEDFMAKLGYHLSQVLGSIPDCMSQATRIVLVPHRGLHSIPFASVKVNIGGKDKLLAEWFPQGLYIVPSISICSRLLKRSREDDCSVTNEHHSDKLVSYTAENVYFSRSIVHNIQSKRIFQRPHALDFNRDAVSTFGKSSKVRSCDVLHFTCHGKFADLETAVFDPSRAIETTGLCGYQRGETEAKDLLLSIRRIWEVVLDKCKLVCIVACSGATVNTLSSSDDCFGTGSAFLLAGARHVICSLWPVADISAALIISRFYELWRDGESESQGASSSRSISGCLMRAQLWYRALSMDEQRVELSKLFGQDVPESSFNFLPSPQDFYNWAAFIVLGPPE